MLYSIGFVLHHVIVFLVVHILCVSVLKTVLPDSVRKHKADSELQINVNRTRRNDCSVLVAKSLRQRFVLYASWVSGNFVRFRRFLHTVVLNVNVASTTRQVQCLVEH